MGAGWCGRTLPSLTAAAAGDLELVLDATTDEFSCLPTDRADDVEGHVPVSPRSSTRGFGSAPVALPGLSSPGRLGSCEAGRPGRPGWFKACFTTRAAVGGFLNEDRELWDSSGQLVDACAEDDIAPSDGAAPVGTLFWPDLALDDRGDKWLAVRKSSGRSGPTSCSTG